MSELKFKISSGLKSIIGKELITDDLIAIFELVKNSYDANAKSVHIVFQNIKKLNENTPAKILVIDDGEGMSKADITDKWLFVAFSDKKPIDVNDFREKLKRGRIFAGAKGIGRFSCDRLGKELKLYSKQQDKSVVHYLKVDWGKFEESQEKEFQTINADYNDIKKVELDNYDLKEFQKGTILEILTLNSPWNYDKLLTLKRYLQRLINPSQIQNSKDFSIYLEAKEFSSEEKERVREKEKKNENGEADKINGKIENIIFEKLNIKTTSIIATIRDNGIVTELVDKGDFIFKLNENNDYPMLNDIEAHVFFLNRSAKTTFTRTMGLEPVNYGSIFLYKNGVRVHPYGDLKDDWLGLDKRKAQGQRRFLGTRELLGRIEISGYQPNFVEVSSRDGGVVKNQAYDQLTEFITEKVVKRIEKYVVEGIDWDREKKVKSIGEMKKDSIEVIQKIVGQVKDPEKNISFNPNLLTIVRSKEVEKLPDIISYLEGLSPHIKDPKERSHVEQQLKSAKAAIEDLELETEVKKKEALFWAKAMATDDKVVQGLTHTIEISTLAINKAVNRINLKIGEKKPISEIAPDIDIISKANNKIKILSSIASQSNFNLLVSKIRKDVVLYIKEYMEKIRSANEDLDFRFSGDGSSFFTSFSPLEILIVLDNFIHNSDKAKATVMNINFQVIKKQLHIYIADNGKGVEDKIAKYIFNRGITSTDGAGIGLSHIKEIIESMGGSIRFVGNDYNNLGKGACFEVVIK